MRLGLCHVWSRNVQVVYSASVDSTTWVVEVDSHAYGNCWINSSIPPPRPSSFVELHFHNIPHVAFTLQFGFGFFFWRIRFKFTMTVQLCYYEHKNKNIYYLLFNKWQTNWNISKKKSTQIKWDERCNIL